MVSYLLLNTRVKLYFRKGIVPFLAVKIVLCEGKFLLYALRIVRG